MNVGRTHPTKFTISNPDDHGPACIASGNMMAARIVPAQGAAESTATDHHPVFKAEDGRSSGAVLRVRSSLRQCHNDPRAMTEGIASAEPPGSFRGGPDDAAVRPAT